MALIEVLGTSILPIDTLRLEGIRFLTFIVQQADVTVSRHHSRRPHPSTFDRLRQPPRGYIYRRQIRISPDLSARIKSPPHVLAYMLPTTLEHLVLGEFCTDPALIWENQVAALVKKYITTEDGVL